MPSNNNSSTYSFLDKVARQIFDRDQRAAERSARREAALGHTTPVAAPVPVPAGQLQASPRGVGSSRSSPAVQDRRTGTTSASPAKGPAFNTSVQVWTEAEMLPSPSIYKGELGGQLDGVLEFGRVGGRPTLRSMLMPTEMVYAVGTFAGPIYTGEEGIKGAVYSSDLKRALLVSLKKDRLRDSHQDPIALCEEVGRALMEAFSYHSKGRDFLALHLQPELLDLIQEAPMIVLYLEQLSVELAPEYRRLFREQTLDRTRIAERAKLWTRPARFDSLGLAASDSGLASSASRPLLETSKSSGVFGTPSASQSGPTGSGLGNRSETTPAATRAFIPPETDGGRAVTFKDVKAEFKLPPNTYLILDEATQRPTRLEFRPHEQLLETACERVKEHLGRSITAECGHYYTITDLGAALDGTPIKNDTLVHYNTRLQLFERLENAKSHGITRDARYRRLVAAVNSKFPKDLSASIASWNNHANRDGDPEKYALESDEQWAKHKREKLGLEVGVATSLGQLHSVGEFSQALGKLTTSQLNVLLKVAEKTKSKADKEGGAKPARSNQARHTAAFTHTAVGDDSDESAADQWEGAAGASTSLSVAASSLTKKRQTQTAPAKAQTKQQLSSDQVISAIANLASQMHASKLQPSTSATKHVTFAQTAPKPEPGTDARFTADGTPICDLCRTPGHMKRECTQRVQPEQGGRGRGRGGPGGRQGGRAGQQQQQRVVAHATLQQVGMRSAQRESRYAEPTGGPGVFGVEWADEEDFCEPQAVHHYHAFTNVVAGQGEYIEHMLDFVGDTSVDELEHLIYAGPSPEVDAHLQGPVGVVSGVTVKAATQDASDAKVVQVQSAVQAPADAVCHTPQATNRLPVMSAEVAASGAIHRSVMAAAEQFAATPMAQLLSDGKYKHVLADAAMLGAQAVARFYGESQREMDIAVVVAQQLGLSTLPHARQRNLAYPSVLLIGSLVAMLQWCDAACITWSHDLARSVVDMWLSRYRRLPLMQEVQQLVDSQPLDAATQALQAEWQQLPEYAEEVAAEYDEVEEEGSTSDQGTAAPEEEDPSEAATGLQRSVYVPTFSQGSSASRGTRSTAAVEVWESDQGSTARHAQDMAMASQLPVKRSSKAGPHSVLPAVSEVWTPESMHVAMHLLCVGPEPWASARDRLGVFAATLQSKGLEAAVAYLNMVWNRAAVDVPEEICYDHEPEEWANPVDVVPPTVPGILAKAMCLVGSFFSGLSVLTAVVCAKVDYGEAAAWQELGNTTGMYRLMDREQGKGLHDVDPAYLRTFITRGGDFPISQLTVLPDLRRSFIIGRPEDEETSSDEEYHCHMTTATASHVPGPLCKCGGVTVLQQGMWVCTDLKCPHELVDVEQRDAAATEQLDSLVGMAAHQQLPQSFEPLSRLDPRPGTLRGRLQGTGPLPLPERVGAMGQKVQVVSMQDMVKAFSPEELHQVITSSSGVCQFDVTSSSPVAHATLRDRDPKPEVDKHRPAVSLQLSPEKLRLYKSLQPEVFFFANATAEEGITLRHGQYECFEYKSLMADTGANCLIMVQALADKLEVEYEDCKAKVHTSVAGEQMVVGQVVTPFELVVARGSALGERVMIVGTEDVPVYVTKHSPVFRMLIDQHVMHELAGMVDPVTQRFHYRPLFWAEGNGDAWYSLPGFMYQRPKVGAAVAHHANVAVVTSETDAARMHVDLPSTVVGGLEAEGVVEEVDCIASASERVLDTQWGWQELQGSFQGTLQQQPCFDDAEVRELQTIQSLAQIAQVDATGTWRQDPLMRAAGTRLVDRWQQVLAAPGLEPDWVEIGFPLVGPNKAGWQQQRSLAYMLPILQDLLEPGLHVKTWEDGEMTHLLQWLDYITGTLLYCVAAVQGHDTQATGAERPADCPVVGEPTPPAGASEWVPGEVCTGAAESIPGEVCTGAGNVPDVLSPPLQPSLAESGVAGVYAPGFPAGVGLRAEQATQTELSGFEWEAHLPQALQASCPGGACNSGTPVTGETCLPSLEYSPEAVPAVEPEEHMAELTVHAGVLPEFWVADCHGTGDLSLIHSRVGQWAAPLPGACPLSALCPVCNPDAAEQVGHTITTPGRPNPQPEFWVADCGGTSLVLIPPSRVEEEGSWPGGHPVSALCPVCNTGALACMTNWADRVAARQTQESADVSCVSDWEFHWEDESDDEFADEFPASYCVSEGESTCGDESSDESAGENSASPGVSEGESTCGGESSDESAGENSASHGASAGKSDCGGESGDESAGENSAPFCASEGEYTRVAALGIEPYHEPVAPTPHTPAECIKPDPQVRMPLAPAMPVHVEENLVNPFSWGLADSLFGEALQAPRPQSSAVGRQLEQILWFARKAKAGDMSWQKDPNLAHAARTLDRNWERAMKAENQDIAVPGWGFPLLVSGGLQERHRIVLREFWCVMLWSCAPDYEDMKPVNRCNRNTLLAWIEGAAEILLSQLQWQESFLARQWRLGVRRRSAGQQPPPPAVRPKRKRHRRPFSGCSRKAIRRGRKAAPAEPSGSCQPPTSRPARRVAGRRWRMRPRLPRPRSRAGHVRLLHLLQLRLAGWCGLEVARQWGCLPSQCSPSRAASEEDPMTVQEHHSMWHPETEQLHAIAAVAAASTTLSGQPRVSLLVGGVATAWPQHAQLSGGSTTSAVPSIDPVLGQQPPSIQVGSTVEPCVAVQHVACPAIQACVDGGPAEWVWYDEPTSTMQFPSESICMTGQAASAPALAVPVEAEYGPEPELSEGQAFLRGNQVMAQLQNLTSDYLRSTLPDGEQDLLLQPGYVKDPDHLWIMGNHPEFTNAQLQVFKAELVARRSCFAYQLSDLQGYCGQLGDFTIPLEHDQDIRQRPRRLSPKEKEIVDEKCQELLQAGFITPCVSTKYAQNVVVAAKKDEAGNWTDYRFCIDYRPINKVTPADKYPLHLADELWDRIGSSKFLTKIDMKSGFHNIRIAPEDQPKTAFWWGNRAYMWARAPFGLKCIANFFQRVMDAQIANVGLMHCCVCFIDDLLVFSDTAEQHIKDVCKVLDAFNAVGLKAHPGKSIFGAPVVEYLGHNVSHYGLSPTEAKVAAIRAIQPPTNVSQLRSVLGLLTYYRCYVPNFGAIAAPFNELLSPTSKWTWDPLRQGKALEQLKDIICTPGRVLRRADPKRPFILHTDWSKEGIGGVLGQMDDDSHEYLIACVSRSLNKHERNYSSPQGEMLAAVWGVKSFRHYLRFTRFTLSTDHQALQWLVTTKELTGQVARWALALQEYDFTVVHRPGIKHQNADTVSRMPQATTLDVTGARLDAESSRVGTPQAACLAVLGWGYQHAASFVHYVALNAVLQADHLVVPWTTQDVLLEPGPPVEPTCQQLHDWEQLQEQAVRAVSTTLSALRAVPANPAKPLKAARDPRHGGVHCEGLCTVCIGQPFFARAVVNGIVLYEPFGGLGAGLEMVLRLGIPVKRYLYSDVDPNARAIVQFRLQSLRHRYPSLLATSATRDALAFPQNVYHVSSEDFLRAGALNGDQWLVVAGWECQDLSPAGKGKGLAGKRSRSFYPLLNLLATLQLLQQQRPPGFIIENTAFQQHASDQVALSDFNLVCDMLGPPVVLDAAQFGSYAHRVRNFWTNLADPCLIQRAVRDVHRDPSRCVADILPPNLVPLKVEHADVPPRYVCNQPGEPLRAFPCLVAHGCSRAFRDLGPGMLFDKLT